MKPMPYGDVGFNLKSESWYFLFRRDDRWDSTKRKLSGFRGFSGKLGINLRGCGLFSSRNLIPDKKSKLLKLEVFPRFKEGGQDGDLYHYESFFAGGLRGPEGFPQLAEQVSSRIKKDCPGIRWKDSYATMGRFDVVDIVEAENPKEIEKAAMIIRGFGHSTTETLVGTPWKDFLAGL